MTDRITALRALKKARIGLHVTCPASRHAAMIAEVLMKGEAYPMLTEDPAHCGETIASVVTALWEARALIAQGCGDATR